MQARMLTQSREQEQKLVFYAITLSLVLHIVFFTLFVILPEIGGQRHKPLDTIQIKFMGGGGTGGDTPKILDTPPPAQNTDAGEKMPTTTPKPANNVESVYIPPPVVETTVPPTQYSTVKPEDTTPKPADPVDNTDNVKTFSSQTVKPSNATQKVEQIQRDLQRTQQNTQQATQRSEAAVQESQTGNESVSSAIQQLRDKQAAEAAAGGGSSGTGSGPGSGSGDGAGLSGPLAVYLGIIIPIIEKNWSFSPAMFNGTPRMEVVLSVKIMPNGEIKDITFAKKSGNAYLDESAFKAMAKSSPLPAFGSSGIKRPNIELQFRFTPKGLQY